MKKATVMGGVACGLALTVGGCGSTATTSLPDQGVRTIATGTFDRTGATFVSGEARVAESFGDIYLELGDGFNATTQERMRLAFGRDGTLDPSTRFTSVKSASGRQVYFVPESINPYQYNEVYVWGNKTRDVLAVATLTRAPETLANVHSTTVETTEDVPETTEQTQQAAAETDSEN
ncbi:MAG: hypothetical protein ACF8Q5_04910 [Phycisphaerales bacterium JB040]